MPASVAHFPSNARKLDSWVDGFIDYTKEVQSPELFRRWSAIATIAAALEQRVWIQSQGRVQYPNLYVMLVGPPGVGKTNAVSEIEEIWREAVDPHDGPFMAPVSLTKAALMDTIGESKRIIHGNGSSYDFNSVFCAVDEFSALVPMYDSDLLNALTRIYDCGRYSEKRRSRDQDLVIDRPQATLLVGTTPSFLAGLMPPSAWEQGFLARVQIIYHDHAPLKPLGLLQEAKMRDQSLRNALVDDLRNIIAPYRQLKFDQAAANLIENWHILREQTAPKHPRLRNYNARRTTHLLKLSIIAAMEHSDTHTINVRAVQRAQEWLAEAESYMDNIFKAMTYGGEAQIMEELHHYIMAYTLKKGAITRVMVEQWLLGRVSAQAMPSVIAFMERSGAVRVTMDHGIMIYTANDYKFET